MSPTLFSQMPQLITGVSWVSQPVPIMVVRIFPTLFSQLGTENSISFQFIFHWIEWADPKHGVCNSLCTLYLFTDLVILPLSWLCHLGQFRPDAIVLWCDINDTFPCYKADHDLASITQCIGYLSCLISYAGMSWQVGNKLKYQEVQEHDPNTLDYLLTVTA